MVQSKIDGVRIEGVSCCVPACVLENDYYLQHLDSKTIKRIAKMTGIQRRRCIDVGSGVCASDLCFAAAERLLERIGWERASVDVLILVTESPDYRVPATAGVLQDRLGLPESCAAFDVNMACSGYVYGLWLAYSLIAGAGARRVLLLAGDTSSISISGQRLEDRATMMLFGDAGSATAVAGMETGEEAGAWFALGTDGKGYDRLYTPAGGYRNLVSEAALAQRAQPDGGKIRDIDLHMDGKEIFNFSVSRVPPLIGELLELSGLEQERIDYWVFHQANKFILDHIAAYVGIESERVPLSLGEFGNTSSASIPLTLVSPIGAELQSGSHKLCLLGFGAGYSWGGAVIDVARLGCADLLDYEGQGSGGG